MLNLKSLFTKYLQTALFKQGGTLSGMTTLSGCANGTCGSIVDKYNAFGYCGDISKTTIGTVASYFGLKVGAALSQITSSTTSGSVMFTTGTYNFIKTVHGLFAFPAIGRIFHTTLPFNSAQTAVQVNSNRLILTSNPASSTSVSNFTATSNSYYSLTVNSCKAETTGPNLKTITLYVQCTTPASSFTKIGTVPFTSAGPGTTYFTLTNTAGTTLAGYISSTNLYVCGGYAGHGFQGTITYFCPRA